MRKKTHMITEGAMMVAIVGAFLLIDRQLANLLEVLLFWVFPLPILIFTVRYGLRDGILCGVCMILVSFIVATPQSVFLVVCSVVMGIVYGYGVYSHKSNLWLLIMTFVAAFVYYLVTMLLFASFFGYDMISEGQMIYEMFSGGIGQTLMGSSSRVFVRALLIVLLLLTPFLQAIVTHLLAVLLLKRLQIAEVRIKPVAQIMMPKWLSWLMIAVYVLIFLLLHFGDISAYPENVETILLLLEYIIMVVFIGFGVIALMVLGAVYKMKWLSLLAMAACFIIPQVIMLIGMFDTATDIRRDFIRRYYHAG